MNRPVVMQSVFSLEKGPTKVALTFLCPLCQKTVELVVPLDNYMAWEHGAFVQDAFPTLTPAQRELFVTGYCGECWDKMFKSMAEDEAAEDEAASEQDARENR